MFPKECKRVNGSIFLATPYSVNESLSGVSSPKDLKDEVCPRDAKKFLR